MSLSYFKKMQEKDSGYYDLLRRNEWKHAADFGPSTQTRYRIMLGLIRRFAQKGSVLLDTGCGSGNFLKKCITAGYDSAGTDFSQEAIRSSKSKLGSGSILYRADLTDASTFQNGKYDVVVCSEVLEHIEDDQKAIATLKILLKEDGVLIVSVPYLMSKWTKHDDFSGHVRRYEKTELDNKLMSHGLKPIKTIIWGALLYEIYSQFLCRVDPGKLTGPKEAHYLKKLAAKFLYELFFIDDLLAFTKRGRRIYVVARKA